MEERTGVEVGGGGSGGVVGVVGVVGVEGGPGLGDRIIHFPLNTLIRVSQTAAHEYEIKGRMYFQFQKGMEGNAEKKKSTALQSCSAAYLPVTPSRLPLECKYGPLRLWSCEGKDDISIMLSQHSGLGRAVAPLHPGPNPPIVFLLPSINRPPGCVLALFPFLL